MLFLATHLDGLLDVAAVLLLWRRGFVEDLTPPAHPRHLAAQQLLALALQEGRFGTNGWRDWWGDLALMDDAAEVLAYLRQEDFLVEDSGMLMIGPRAEREFGGRNFMDLLSSFIAELELRVVAGTKVIGFVSPLSLPRPEERESRPLTLAGRGWFIRSVDWERHTIWVEEVARKGDVRWHSGAVAQSFELCQAKREVLLGATPEAVLSKRVSPALVRLRSEREADVSDRGQVMVRRPSGAVRLWTWAGLKANATLLAGLGLGADQADNEGVVLPDETAPVHLRDADPSAVPTIDLEGIEALKFSQALPQSLAARTLGERLADPPAARRIARTAVLRVVEG